MMPGFRHAGRLARFGQRQLRREGWSHLFLCAHRSRGRCRLEASRECSVYFGTGVSDELGEDGKTADNDASCNLSQRPQAHYDDIVADVWVFDNFPGVVCP